jgi:hypothetical protein
MHLIESSKRFATEKFKFFVMRPQTFFFCFRLFHLFFSFLLETRISLTSLKKYTSPEYEYRCFLFLRHVADPNLKSPSFECCERYNLKLKLERSPRAIAKFLLYHNRARITVIHESERLGLLFTTPSRRA